MRKLSDLEQEQVDVIEFGMEGADMLLLADPGFGKTAIALTIIQRRVAAGLIKRALVVAPMKVARSTWPYELSQWEHCRDLRIAVAAGEPARIRRRAIESDAHIVTINYENLPWLIDNFARNGKTLPFEQLVLDEIDKMKNPSSNRFKKMRTRVDHWKARLGMTGTPTPNHLHEIWGEAFLVDGGEALGTSVTKFREKYTYKADYMGYDIRMQPDAERDIYEAIAPFTYRLSAKGNAGEVRERFIDVDLEPKQRAAYDEMEAKLITLLDDISDPVVAKSAAACSNKLIQIAAGFVYHVEEDANGIPGPRQTIHLSNGKLDALANLVGELQGQQLLVVYAYKAQLEALKKRFPQLWGLGKGSAGDETLTRWNRGEGEILAFHPMSAGHGLDMHRGGCHHLVYLTQPWSSGAYRQVNARIDRRGQESTVYIHTIRGVDTIDERMTEVIQKKLGGERALLDAMKEWTDRRKK